MAEQESAGCPCTTVLRLPRGPCHSRRSFPADRHVLEPSGEPAATPGDSVSDDWLQTLRGRYAHEIEKSEHLLRGGSFNCRITVVKMTQGNRRYSGCVRFRAIFRRAL